MDDRFFVKKQKLALPMGRQFEALDQTNKEIVLVHRFAKGDSDKKDIWRGVFNKHAERLESIQDPSLPVIIDYGVDDKGPFLVMKEPKGLRLSDVVNCGPMMAASVRQMVSQFLQAFASAAKQGVTHSALNPLLVLVGESEDEGNRFLLPDIGFAEVHNDIQGEGSRILGDPVFLSPRQLRGEEQDEIGSLFSLGQLCYYCLAGGHPFGGMTLPAILQGYEGGQLPGIDQFRHDLPVDFVQWINKITAVDRDQRFQSVSEALAALPQVGGLQAIPMDLTGVISVQPVSATSTQKVAPHNRPKLITGTQAIRPVTAGVQLATGASPVGAAGVTGDPQLSRGVDFGSGAQQLVVKAASLLDTTKKKVIASCAGGGLLLLVIIGLVAAGSDDPEDSNSASPAEVSGGVEAMDAETKLLFRGLAYAWNFDHDLLPANTTRPAVVPIRNASYEGGLNQNSLVLGPSNYYAVPREKGLFIENYDASTLNVWIKVPGQWKRNPIVVGNKMFNLKSTTGWCIAAVPQGEAPMKFRLSTNDGQNARFVNSSLLVTADSWHMFSIVFDSSETTKFYQDGILVGELDIPDTRKLHTNKDLFIGTDGDYRAIFSRKIQIDQLYIWHRALKEQELKKLYRDKSSYIP